MFKTKLANRNFFMANISKIRLILLELQILDIAA